MSNFHQDEPRNLRLEYAIELARGGVHQETILPQALLFLLIAYLANP
jgi:hypothetical protein